MFQRFDQNQDGVVSAEELPERIRERMLERADSNADGGIDKNEFQAHIRKMMQQRGQGSGAQGARGRMQRGPMKGKGQGKPEGRQRQRPNPPKLSMRDPENMDADKIMGMLDRSGDGVLQKSELPKMMSSKLDKIDADGDEVVSQSELRSTIEKMKAKAMDAGKGRYSTDSDSSKGKVPKRPGSGN
jgi:Ca2+-binding EF-hand superfamily protein